MSDRKMRGLLCVLAVGGQLYLLASAWLLPIVSEYDLVGDNISELVLGRSGGVQALAFLVSGLAAFGLAYVLVRSTRGWRGSAFGSALLLVNGLGLIVAALVPTDRVDSPADLADLSPGGLVHVSAAALGLVSAVLAMFVWSLVFARDCTWRPVVTWSVLLAGGSLALLFAQSQGPLVGLMQRLLVTLVAAWMIMVAIRALTVHGARASRAVRA